MPRLDFIGPTYPLQTGADVQRTVNLYPEAIESGKGKGPYALVGTPGLTTLTTLPVGPVRSLLTCFGAIDGVDADGEGTATGNPRVFAIAGPVGGQTRLYELTAGGTSYTDRGALFTNTGAGPVSMAYSHDSLVIAHGTNYPFLFRFNSNSLIELTPAIITWDALKLAQVIYMDGYFIGIRGTTQKFYISNLNDPFHWDELDFAQANAKPDILTALQQVGNELWFYGQETIQPFWNTGDADFPFRPIAGRLIDTGCGATWSVAKIDEARYWLSHDPHGRGFVYKAVGQNIQRISNHAVEQAIRSYASVSDAYAWTYQDNGHDFYVLQFGAANKTWVYDESTGMWHERSYLDGVTGQEIAHRASCHTFAFWEQSPYKGKHIVGDRLNGNIYELSDTAYTDAGAYIRRMRRTPHISNEAKRLFYHSLQVDHLTGTALTSGQGSAPIASLRFSNDGGQTWSQEYQASMGAIGQTKYRLKWNRLGSGRDRVFEVFSTEPIKQVWMDGYVNFSEGAS